MALNRLTLNVLSEDDKKKIYVAALEVLERTGMQIDDAATVDLLDSAGADVIDKSTVKFPTYLVEEALRTAPSRITMYTTSGQPYIKLADDNYALMTQPGVLNLIDPDSNQRRPMTYQDICHYSSFIDQLDHIEMIGSWMISDRPTMVADRYQAQAILSNSIKPFYLAPLTYEGIVDVVEMCTRVAGGEKELAQKPFFTTGADPIPPLCFPELSLKKLQLMATKKLPVILNVMVMAGATGPMDLYGSLILMIANNMAGITIGQLTKKGAPVIVGGVGATVNMRSGQIIYGGPELELLCSALAEMGHYMGLPVWGTGGCSSSQIMDAQAANEMTSSLIMSILTGAHLIHDVGYLNNGLTGSYEALLFCNDLNAHMKRFVRGIDVGSIEEICRFIDKVGRRGEYLTTKDTFEKFKGIVVPEHKDRNPYETWVDHGSTNFTERLNTAVKDILSQLDDSPRLTEDKLKAIDDVVQKAVQLHG